ncbi:putative uncharacterized protein [Clostridium sp. CAG:354]|jgi:hypothetical protein|nr:hypothetical protein [Clostridium sp.]CDE11049.1 putative uncharacterized protein [Clostridium sp. CAG:354]
MESTIIVAFITALGTIINTVISKKTNKKINNIDDINQKLDFMRNESKKDMLEHTIDADKTYLINFLSDLENGVPKTEVQIKRTYEIYERYVNNGGNSYVHDKWEEVKKKGLL